MNRVGELNHDDLKELLTDMSIDMKDIYDDLVDVDEEVLEEILGTQKGAVDFLRRVMKKGNLEDVLRILEVGVHPTKDMLVNTTNPNHLRLKPILALPGIWNYASVIIQVLVPSFVSALETLEVNDQYVKDVENYVDRLRKMGDKRSADEIEHHFSIVINELLPLYAEIAVRIKKWSNYDPTVKECRQSRKDWNQRLKSLMKKLWHTPIVVDDTTIILGNYYKTISGVSIVSTSVDELVENAYQICQTQRQPLSQAARPRRITRNTWTREHAKRYLEQSTLQKMPATEILKQRKKKGLKVCQSVHNEIMMMMSLNFNQLFGHKVVCSSVWRDPVNNSDIFINNEHDGLVLFHLQRHGLFDLSTGPHPCLKRMSTTPLMIQVTVPGHIYAAFVTPTEIEIWDTGAAGGKQNKIKDQHNILAAVLHLMFNDKKLNNPETRLYRPVKLYRTGVQSRMWGKFDVGSMVALDLFCQTWIYFIAWMRFVLAMSPMQTIKFLYSMPSQKQKELISEYQMMLNNASDPRAVKSFNALIVEHDINGKKTKTRAQRKIHFEYNIDRLSLEDEADFESWFKGLDVIKEHKTFNRYKIFDDHYKIYDGENVVSYIFNEHDTVSSLEEDLAQINAVVNEV